MTRTRAKQQILDDAARAGYTTKVDGSGTAFAFKVDRWGKVSKGLAIYSDGTAYDLSVPLSVARGIRSHTDMRHFLGI